MRKFTFSMITLLAFVLTAFSVQAQNRDIVYEDDFESYTAGDFLAESNPEWWTTWSDDPGSAEDAVISSDEAASGVNSVYVSGTNDMLLKLGNKTSGVYWVNFNFFVPVGMAGYYNVQHYESPGVEWAYEIYFKADGTGFMHAGGENAATFTYTQGAWFTIENMIDLTNDWAQVYFDDEMIYEWQFSLQAQGEPGQLQLGAVNFFAGAETGETPAYYFDDINFEADIEELIYWNDFDDYNVGDYIAVVDPDNWTTWANAPGTTEDALIVDEQSNSPSNSLKVDGVSDLVFKMGNKTSGKFVIDFNYYVPSGFGAYYNFQHYQEPGIEWAFEVYFATDGSGTMNAGGNDAATFTYNHDEWIEITNVIDLDADWAQVYFDEELIYEWQFSLGAQGDVNILQMGGINFYAGAPEGETSTYFVDDLVWIALVPPAQDPTIDIVSSQIITTLPEGDSETIVRSLGNTGESLLVYDIVTSFDEPAKKTSSPIVSTAQIGRSNGVPVAAPNYTPGEAAPANRDVTLTYSGENASAIGLTNANQWRVAARFPAEMTVPYNGMYLTAVDVFINDPADDHKIMIWDMGSINLPGPGELVYEQGFFPNIGEWTTVVLTEPVYVSGRDLWVGYWMDQPAGIFPAGVDAGPAVPDGDWISSGPGWSHLSSNPDLNANWNIKALLTGDAGSVWLTVSPNAGEVEPGEADDISIDLDAAGLTPQTIYKAKMHVRSNDPANQQINISVWITVLVGLNENGEQAYVKVYPNPALDVLKLESNTEITSIILSNMLGQVVYEGSVGQSETRIATDAFETGMYILTIQTVNGTATQKIMIE
ncbi:MAG: T9SS type A sorting domain-containing protein [Bacteroidales bacterium]|nr:T9SS type A sorting domain-containing protein [Bacteroidales bacterium]HOI32065.1 T9SS type A sorting domain-containing protein [Bacteroidales bacterium]